VLGRANRDVGAGVLLACLVIAPPERIRADQRRKAFRIPPTLRVVGELERIVPTAPEAEDPAPPATVLVQVEDISFTGACLSAPNGELRELYGVGDTVRCRMVFPGLERVASLAAVVRRADTVPCNRNERQDILGIEFQVTDVASRRDLEFIRDYVLSEQRSLLARRVHVLGGS
jgi:c-di-GMP-binding flagellar brake protein YcgR